MRALCAARRAGAALAAMVAVTIGAHAADKLLVVDWSNPELQALAKEQQASSARSLGPQADDKLAKLKLPVVAFDHPPGVVENTFRLGPKPATVREVVVDEANPVWYKIVENYGDLTVSIEADLRVQHEFPSSYPVYGQAAPGAAPTAGPVVSVFDEQNENGIEGLMAEYTIMRYGVPYTVTIECSREAKAQCNDTTQIAKDSELLKTIRANAPAPR